MNSIALGFAGVIASGKSTISKGVAEVLKWPRVSFGDYVRSEAIHRGLSLERKSLQSLGASLIDADLNMLCESVLAQADWKPGQSIIIDGIRHTDAFESLRGHVAPSELLLVYIDVDAPSRQSRLNAQGVSRKELPLIDAHSTEIQVSSTLSTVSDLRIDGSCPPHRLINQVVSWVQHRRRASYYGSGPF